MDKPKRYALIGALGAFLFCLGVGMLVRSCELRMMARAESAMVFLPPGPCVASEDEIRAACAAVGVRYR